MNPEKLVASLELSQELVAVAKEKGVELPESYFWWENVDHEWYCKPEIGTKNWLYKRLPAYTASELGEMLPNYDEWVTVSTPDHPPEGDSDGIKINHYRVGKYWYSEIDSETYIDGFDLYELNAFKGATEADARAKMLNHLIREGLIN